MPASRQDSRSGQALVELVVGLVGLLVLAAVLLQVGRLGRAHTRALIEAREEAGEDAMAEVYQLAFPGPNYIADWSPGPDGRRYSADDEWTAVSVGNLSSDLLRHAHPAELNSRVPGNPVSSLAGAASPLGGFHLVHGRVQTDPIPLLPVVRHLVYEADEITMEANAWLIWTGGLE